MGAGKQTESSSARGMKRNQFDAQTRRQKAYRADIQGSEDNGLTGLEDSIGTLTGGIAHDLNTVITTIYGYCELALESIDEDAEPARNIQAILSAADRARLLTQQLLDLSRNTSPEKVPVRVSDALADTVDFIKQSVSDEIRIILNVKTPDALVMAQPVQLFRIFLNLSLNAVQAMQENGGILTITEETIKVPGRKGAPGSTESILISFSDTGVGMNEETAGRIFSPFFTGGKQKGTGLGLTVVANGLRELGGTVDVATAPGSGTTFNLIIPNVFFGPLPEKH